MPFTELHISKMGCAWRCHWTTSLICASTPAGIVDPWGSIFPQSIPNSTIQWPIIMKIPVRKYHIFFPSYLDLFFQLSYLDFFPVTWIFGKKQDYQFFSKGVCTWILRYPLENIVVGSHFGSNSEIRPKLRIRICGWQTDFEVSGRFNMLKYAWNIIISLYK